MSNREKPTHLPESVDVVSLRILSDALRKEMPEGFEWNYMTPYERLHCGTAGCALGLAIVLGITQENGIFDRDGDATAEPFGLPKRIADGIFFGDVYQNKRLRDVTPTDVADAIDYYLDNGRLP